MKHFFEPKDGSEEYPYEIPIPIQDKYEKLDKFYEKFYNTEQLEKAKIDAKLESESKKFIKNNFIYGEITFRAISYLLEYAINKYKINNEGCFYDLGSGTGRCVIGAALSYPFKKYIGIELLDSLYNTSIEIKCLFEKDYLEYKKNNSDILPVYNNSKNFPEIELIHGDFLIEKNLKDASFIFINSTTFTDELLFNLSEKFNKECPKGCIVANTTNDLVKLDKGKWEFLPYFRRYMSWGIATINLYKKIKE